MTPHQRHTSGGVYAIQQLARHLSPSVDVSLLVQRGAPVSVPGVNTVTSEEAAGASDAVILHADAKISDAEHSRFAKLGPVVLYLQGFGQPGNPRVFANLHAVRRAVCSARWLVSEAQKAGAEAAYAPYGWDRGLFRPGPPVTDRDPVVSMLTHTLDWKGTDDGLAALRQVLASGRSMEIVTFGVARPELPTTHLAAVTRQEVADVLRHSAVFVCPSWEEGFGMPGMEALACGAALATTDTKGSRDYAVHEQTALVSEPRDTRALAEHVTRLLDDRSLRARLASAGKALVDDAFPEWGEAAQRFLRALRDVLGH